MCLSNLHNQIDFVPHTKPPNLHAGDEQLLVLTIWARSCVSIYALVFGWN